MLTETELARLIVSWKNQMGEEIRGRMCVPIEGRREMYKHLIKTLIELHGYAQEDFEGKTYRMVLDASVNPNSERLEGWRKAVTADWNNALDSFFPQQLLQHDSSAEPKRKTVEKTEYVNEDPRLEKDNPIDPSIFAGLPPVNDPVDEEFMKMLKEVGDE